jgi:hypothetical protein
MIIEAFERKDGGDEPRAQGHDIVAMLEHPTGMIGRIERRESTHGDQPFRKSAVVVRARDSRSVARLKERGKRGKA